MNENYDIILTLWKLFNNINYFCRYIKTKDEELVEYLADGVKIGEEMRYKAETMEGEKFGDGEDLHNWDSLSTRMRRARRQQAHRSHLQKAKGKT